MFGQIILNCERIVLLAGGDPHGWETLNVLSSLLFLMVAYWGWRTYRQSFPQTRNRDIEALILLSTLIGIGSTLFHSTAQIWAVLLDVAPIVTLVFAYLILYCRRFLGWNKLHTFLAVLALLGLNLAMRQLFERGSYNWAYAFLPTIIGVWVMAGYLYYIRHPLRHNHLWIGILFPLAVVARSIDMHLCRVNPYGSHFLWHALNAGVLYFLLRSVVDFYTKPPQLPPPGGEG